MKPPFFWRWRLAAVGAVLVAYFAIWRPARMLMAHALAAPLLGGVAAPGASYQVIPVAARVEFVPTQVGATAFDFPMPAGIHFLLGALIFCLFAPSWRYLVLLWSAHLIVGLISIGLLAIGLLGWDSGFTMYQFVFRYVLPALSLAAPAWMIVNRREA